MTSTDKQDALAILETALIYADLHRRLTGDYEPYWTMLHAHRYLLAQKCKYETEASVKL